MSDYHTAREFAQFIKGLGFRGFVAGGIGGDGPRGYGIITDAEGSRVLSFSFSDGGSLGGNYGPPSRNSGTGWRMNGDPYSLKSAEDVRRALYATAPDFCRPASPQSRGDDGWKYYSTLAQYQAQYQASSKFEEI